MPNVLISARWVAAPSFCFCSSLAGSLLTLRPAKWMERKVRFGLRYICLVHMLLIYTNKVQLECNITGAYESDTRSNVSVAIKHNLELKPFADLSAIQIENAINKIVIFVPSITHIKSGALIKSCN